MKNLKVVVIIVVLGFIIGKLAMQLVENESKDYNIDLVSGEQIQEQGFFNKLNEDFDLGL